MIHVLCVKPLSSVEKNPKVKEEPPEEVEKVEEELPEEVGKNKWILLTTQNITAPGTC